MVKPHARNGAEPCRNASRELDEAVARNVESSKVARRTIFGTIMEQETVAAILNDMMARVNGDKDHGKNHR